MRTDRGLTRRNVIADFSRAAIAGVSLPYLVSSRALGGSGAVAASNRITMGCIGLGIQGTGNMREFLRRKDVQIAAVCDVRSSQCVNAKTIVDQHYGNVDCRTCGDFRSITGDERIDAVSIATPDHWHVLIGLDAARHGKHMYYEKPIGWSLAAGKTLRNAIQRYGVVFQFGTQQRSSRDFRYACELVRNGRIGEVQIILVGVPASIAFAYPPNEAVPQGLDYNMWLGPAPWAPHSFERCRPYTSRPDADWTANYSLWYHISDYCTGFIENWGIHHVDIAQWGNGTQDTGPTEVEGRGRFPVDGIADCAVRWQVENRFPGKATIVHMDNTSSAEHPAQIPGFSQGILFRGTDGWVFVSRSKLAAQRESLLQSVIGPNEIHLLESSSHHGDFLDAVKAGRQAVCPVEVAVRSNTLCQLSDMAIRLGRKLRWDPQQEQCIGDAEANRLLARPMRSPWHL